MDCPCFECAGNGKKCRKCLDAENAYTLPPQSSIKKYCVWNIKGYSNTSKIIYTLEDAEIFASQLAKQHPNQEFLVFERKAMYKAEPVVHTTIY